MTKRKETALKLLKGAKKHLRKDGWHQGWYFARPDGESFSPSSYDREGACCVIGSLNRAAWDEGLGTIQARGRHTLTERYVIDPLETVLFGTKKERKKRLGTWNVREWNDESGRTKKEVIAFLDERIAILEAKQ